MYIFFKKICKQVFFWDFFQIFWPFFTIFDFFWFFLMDLFDFLKIFWLKKNDFDIFYLSKFCGFFKILSDLDLVSDLLTIFDIKKKWVIFKDFLDFLFTLNIFFCFDFWGFWIFVRFCYGLFGFFLKLLKLLIKVSNVTTGHKKGLKLAKPV